MDSKYRQSPNELLVLSGVAAEACFSSTCKEGTLIGLESLHERKSLFCVNQPFMYSMRNLTYDMPLDDTFHAD